MSTGSRPGDSPPAGDRFPVPGDDRSPGSDPGRDFSHIDDIRVVPDPEDEARAAEAAAAAEGEGAARGPLKPPEWLVRAAREFRENPKLRCWAISGAVHALLLLLTTLLGIAMPRPAEKHTALLSDFSAPEPEKLERREAREVFHKIEKSESVLEFEEPVFSRRVEEIDEPLAAGHDDLSGVARGDTDALGDIPLGGFGRIKSMGVGSGGTSGRFGHGGDGGSGGGLGLRGSGKKRALARFGGSKETEKAVNAALAWLARHQDANGSWNAARYRDPRADRVVCRVGCTGLALLAFLGAGHTSKTGDFKDNVSRAQSWLMGRQKPNGLIAEKTGGGMAAAGYNHAIAGLALAEAYGMTREPQLRNSAQAAVNYSTRVHQVPYSGWRYDPRKDSDTSVTGWFVMQLKSAQMSGLRIDGIGFQGASRFLSTVTTREGLVGYRKPTGTPCMTAVGMVCRQFMGVRNTESLMRKGEKYILKHPPDWPLAARSPKGSAVGDRGLYYWYYATLAMFQQGGAGWKKWNATMKRALVPKQRRGGPRDGSRNDIAGSWNPAGWADRSGGRVMSTALGALTLEVYYRYLPLYEAVQD